MQNSLFLRSIILVLLFLGGGHSPAAAQVRISIDGWYCSWDGEPLKDTQPFDFGPRKEAEELMAKICKSVGLDPNFEIREADVPNAVATIEKDKRLILYNPNFIAEIDKQAQTKWASISVIAHEVGHHLQGHTIQKTGSRPELELQADRFSGFSLAQMGATLDEVCAALKASPNRGSATHPPSTARIVAVTAGWKDAKELGDKAVQIAATKPDQKPERQTVLKPTDQNPRVDRPVAQVPPDITGRIVIKESPFSYVITKSGQILRVSPAGEVSLYGIKLPPNDPVQFAWDIQRPMDRMGVSADGQVWAFPLPPNSPRIAIGYVTGLQPGN